MTYVDYYDDYEEQELRQESRAHSRAWAHHIRHPFPDDPDYEEPPKCDYWNLNVDLSILKTKDRQ